MILKNGKVLTDPAALAEAAETLGDCFFLAAGGWLALAVKVMRQAGLDVAINLPPESEAKSAEPVERA
jgi:hypothetical protein